jgi:nucleotide-binding universal stress UspA family protein
MSTSTPIAPAQREDAASTPDLDPRGEPPTPEVVVGVDGSKTSLSAVHWAAREAAVRGAPLRIVHAAPYLGRPGTPGGAPPELPRARRITAAAYTAARHTAPATPVVTEIVQEEPVAALLRAGEAGQLLVLGISTTGAVDELVLASLTQRVAARSTRPVAVVPRSRPEDTTRRPVVALVARDGAAGDAVAAFAAAAARRAGRPLCLLDTRDAAPANADRWAGRFPDIEVRHISMPGASAVDLLDTACPTPLLVLPAGRPRLLHPSPERLHRWLLRHCTCPMALVPSSWSTADQQAGSPG